jgi:hypothetical protein
MDPGLGYAASAPAAIWCSGRPPPNPDLNMLTELRGREALTADFLDLDQAEVAQGVVYVTSSAAVPN